MIIKNKMLSGTIATMCLICEESVSLNEKDILLIEHGRTIIKVCPKCKQAILEMRSCIDKYEEMRK